jgi:acyl-homoserine lactone acylase PvdQ
MSENSVGATVFSTWQFFFYKTLLTQQISDSNLRLALVGNYPFIDYIQRLIHNLIEDPENERYNKICKGAFAEYKGSRHCMYNIAKAMAQAYDFLSEVISPNSNDWMWKHVHVNEYAHVPFSLNPFTKPFFHRETPVGGNGNTVKVSKYSFKRLENTKAFKSTHTPNYKAVIQFADNPLDTKYFYSHDGGQSGNLFAGHYFDFNRDHLNGNLMEAVVGRTAVELRPHTKLVIKPLSTKPVLKEITKKIVKSTEAS